LPFDRLLLILLQKFTDGALVTDCAPLATLQLNQGPARQLRAASASAMTRLILASPHRAALKNAKI
jgi:hypothetical protein